MPRSKNKVAAHRRRKRVLERAKGYWGARKNVWTIAKNHIEKGLTHAFRDRRLKKRDYRGLWIIRINAAARMHGLSYSKLIHLLSEKEVGLNRKVLAKLAAEHPAVFADVVSYVKS
ncbi:MAG: 50S ribosomal protein L20 [Ignavibacteriales bacterium]|nr:50S ribosomal protein L20 [Ignavibacteriaceae bacterium]MCK6613245.1 50S ribosomal protein L20 [Ignavibacteriaceae bacterium]QOJ28900.1 MAG: 50S ribosomal protein L20 [Ignavibacteriales bacterium]